MWGLYEGSVRSNLHLQDLFDSADDAKQRADRSGGDWTEWRLVPDREGWYRYSMPWQDWKQKIVEVIR